MRVGVRESLLACDRLNQLLRIVAHGVLENDVVVFNVPNRTCGITCDGDDVNLFVDFERGDRFVLFEKPGAVQRGNADRLVGRERGRDEDQLTTRS
jgi:hypothetical protein